MLLKRLAQTPVELNFRREHKVHSHPLYLVHRHTIMDESMEPCSSSWFGFSQEQVRRFEAFGLKRQMYVAPAKLCSTLRFSVLPVSLRSCG
jgi:hypothetical protein